MAKAAVQFACSECGYSAGRWFGRCPGCGTFGTLLEEAPPAARAARRRGRCSGSSTSRRTEAARISTGVPELDRVLGGGLVPASLVLVGGEPGVGKSTLLLMALAAMSRDRRALLVTGEESTAQVKLRADRLGGAGQVEVLAETELETVCATLERERPAVCVIDSVQTLYSAELGSAPGSVAQVREAASRLLRVAEGVGRGDDPRRPRHEGRRRRRAARARAPRRLRAPVRGRPLPRASRAARREEPLRLDERARRLRDDRRRPRRRARPVRAVRPQRGPRGGRRRGLRAGGDAADPAGDPGARLAHRPRDAAPRRHRRRPQAARDDRRRALAPRGDRARRRRTSSSTSPAACGSTSPARTSPSRSRSRPRSAACRSGRRRPPSARSGSRAGCARPRRPTAGSRSAPSWGCARVLVPSGTSAHGTLQVVGAETIRQADQSRTRCRRSRSTSEAERAGGRPRLHAHAGRRTIRAAIRSCSRAIDRIAPGTELRQGIDDIIRSHEGALIVDRRAVQALVPLLRRDPARPAVHAAAHVRAVEDGRRDHRQLGARRSSCTRTSSSCRIRRSHGRDRDAAPHRRARREADQRARDLDLARSARPSPSSSATRATSSTRSRTCWRRRTRPSTRSAPTASGSSRCSRG